jgi:peptidoglycan/xylan/chitin deacetylase (PgdA/CDA1 family)
METGMGGTKSKTARQKVRRAFVLPSRYGFSSRKFMGNLAEMIALLKKHEVVGTFPITATVLERHPELANILEGMEVAIHGLRHRDFSHLETGRQIESMKAAMETFRSLGIDVVGFRAPYLRWSESMFNAVEGTALLYDSSKPSGWSCGSELDSLTGMKEALGSYGISKMGFCLPFVRGRIVEMPVAIPDDEILVDRLNLIDGGRFALALTAMMNSAIQSGGHLVLQLHPERFDFFETALDDVLKYAAEKKAWVAPLMRVGKWWLEKPSDGGRWPDDATCALTISGDIDAVTLGDFLARRFGR